MHKPLKYIAAVLLVLFCGTIAFVLVRTALVPSKQIAAAPADSLTVDSRAADHLAAAVRLATVSYQDAAQRDPAVFAAFRRFLQETYPLAHAALAREVIGSDALLYTWRGSDSGKAGIILLAHYDVVPIDPGSETTWEHPAFSGDIADGFVHGRGAIDDKSSVVGIFEAVESLLREGFQPKETVYLAFGNDEEIGGSSGAVQLAKTLKERGVHAAFALDEGMAVVQGVLPGISKPIGLIGLAEKGYVSLELTTAGAGGHSSQPPHETAIGILAGAVSRVEAAPFPASLRGPMREMFEYAGPEMSFPMRMMMANLWLFEPLLKWQLAKDRVTDAALRTTTAPTIFESGSKENVLPMQARCVINFRIMPGDSVASVLAHVERAVRDSRVSVKQLAGQEAYEPSPVSDAHSASFEVVSGSLRQVYPDVPVAPGLVLGATDAKQYVDVADNVYRLQPLLFTSEDLARIHGSNERLSIENLERGIRFYAEVIRNAGP